MSLICCIGHTLGTHVIVIKQSCSIVRLGTNDQKALSDFERI